MRGLAQAGGVVCTLLLLSSLAAAQPRRGRVEPRADSEATLTRARAAYDALDYDRVLPLVDEVLAVEPESSPARCSAYSLKASALASMGNAADAETVFGSLVGECPSFELPADTSPRILLPFSKVREELRAAARAREQERQQRIAGMSLSGEHPKETVAGAPLAFAYQLHDPAGGVSAFDVRYRTAGERDFAALSLARGDGERWSAELSAEWTARRPGTNVEFYLATADETGAALLVVGAPSEPMVAHIAPPDGAPLYRRPWFWLAAAGIVAVGVTSALLIANAGDLPTSDLGTVEFP